MRPTRPADRTTHVGLMPTKRIVGRFLRNWVAPAAFTVAVLLPLRSALADWYQVPTGSMRPTILEGDRIFVSNLAYGLRVPFSTTWIARWAAPVRGDIVTLASPVDGTRLVKRVIGLPGDRLALSDDRLFLNGVPIHYGLTGTQTVERHAGGIAAKGVIAVEALPGKLHPVTITPAFPSRRSFPELVVPPGYYFVMGDNRDDSYDSRYFGVIPAEHIYGRAHGIVLSFDPENHHLPRTERCLKRLI